MKTKRLIGTLAALLVLTSLGTTACGHNTAEKSNVVVKTKWKTKRDLSDEHAAVKLEKDNVAENKRLDDLEKQIADEKAATAKAQGKKPANQPAAKVGSTNASTSSGTAGASLATRTYSGTQAITVNGNNPGFTKAELATNRGAWEQYGNLDGLNRVTVANALLGQKLMPTSERTALTWDPTGWHNKRTSHGWLYNRSHLIGFQLSGENNNPKNLMTGTQSLNNPEMLHYEDDLAAYIKASSSHLVRYQVRPIFRGNELVARGVQLRAQSIGDNTIHFNVYIFNVEDGYKIDYATGYSAKG